MALPPLRAVIGPASRPLSPFDEPPPTLPVLGRPLRNQQEAILAGLGLSNEVSGAETGPEAVLWLGGRTWCTEALLRRFLASAWEPSVRARTERLGARLVVRHATFQEATEPLQDLPAPGRHELALLPPPVARRFVSSQADVIPREFLDDLPEVTVEPVLRRSELPRFPPPLDQAVPHEVWLGEEVIHQVDHWSHLLRANQLALAALGARRRREFEEAPPWTRAWTALRLGMRARGLHPARWARAVSEIGPGCRIHPSAVVEASRLGPGVEVGPCAVVRGSVIGEAGIVEEHATVNLSVLGDRVRIGRRGVVNLSVVMDGAFLSCSGAGFQACVFGRESFVAMDASILDLPFQGEVHVSHRGRKVPSGTRFLGAALGHRARLGAGVVIGYGMEIPGGAAVVRAPERVLVRWPGGEERVVKV